MHFDAYLPTRLVFGPGRLSEAGALARPLGRRALVVTSRSAMARLGYTVRLLESLEAAGVEATVFSELGPTPTTDNVDRGAELARAFRADLVVGLGGGSALDCAKAVATVATGHEPCALFLAGRASPGSGTLPILAIPTTAGTGSEMNRSAIVTDAARRHKDAIRSDYLFPRVALVDPLLTHEMPFDVTAQTGFDALAHAMESYVSPKAQPLADSLALDALRAVIVNLPLALAEPRHAAARERLSLASAAMGYNLSCVGTCLPHRLDKPVCGRYPHVAHGQAVACFYPAWAQHSWRGNVEKFARVAELFDPTLTELPIERRAAACASQLAGFLSRLKLNNSLRALGVSAGDLPDLTQGVSGDLRANPVPVEADEVLGFYERAFDSIEP